MLARGPRTTEEIIAEPAAEFAVSPETIQLFLRLAREIAQRDGTWSLRSSSKQQRLLVALQKAFASGGT
jgi:hypothetical protein